MMKLVIASLLTGSATAFTSAMSKASYTTMKAFTADSKYGALSPMGCFNSLGFAAKADAKTLKR